MLVNNYNIHGTNIMVETTIKTPTPTKTRRSAALLRGTSHITLCAASLIVALGVGMPSKAEAACAQSATNQTCTNSVTITGTGVPGITDTDTLTLTNTATGVVTSDTDNGITVGAGANVTNDGKITGGNFGIK